MLYKVLPGDHTAIICPVCTKRMAIYDATAMTGQPFSAKHVCSRLRDGRTCPNGAVQVEHDGEKFTRIERIEYDPTRADMTRDERARAILDGGFPATAISTDPDTLRMLAAGAVAERDEALALAKSLASTNRLLYMRNETLEQEKRHRAGELAAIKSQMDSMRATLERDGRLSSVEIADALDKVDAAIDTVNASRERLERHMLDYIASLSVLYGPVRGMMEKLGYRSGMPKEQKAFEIADINYAPESDDINAAESTLGRDHSECCPTTTTPETA